MRLSYSSIQTYETCPAKYRFQYGERLPTSPSPALSFGDSLHQALFHFHSRPVPVAPSLEELHEMLDGVWVRDGYTDNSQFAGVAASYTIAHVLLDAIEQAHSTDADAVNAAIYMPRFGARARRFQPRSVRTCREPP